MQDLLMEMLSNYGLKEIEGKGSNEKIIEMGRDLGITIEDDSTFSWCSVALCYYAKKCGYEQPNSASARAWLKMPILVLKPQIGDIVVFWRESPSSWKGHVGIFISKDLNSIYTLGGNQNNSILISAYSQDTLLGYRQLKKLQP